MRHLSTQSIQASVTLLILFLLLPLSPRPARAQLEEYEAYTDTTVYPFANVFNLLFDPDYPALEGWTQQDYVDFMNGVFDSTQTTLFPVVWDYMCAGDSDPRWDWIDIGGITKLTIILNGGANAALGTAMFVPAPSPPSSAGSNWTFIHEFSHMCDYCSDLHFSPIDEFVAQFGPSRMGLSYPDQYDAVFDESPKGIGSNYQHGAIFANYLFTHFGGNAADPTDDLFYHWVYVVN